jgi:hypothetical protein
MDDPEYLKEQDLDCDIDVDVSLFSEEHLEREAEWEKSLQHDIDEAPEEDEAEDQVDHDELEQSPPEHSFPRFSSTLPNHPRYNTHSKLKRLGCCRRRFQ